LVVELEIHSEARLTVDSLGMWLSDPSGVRLVNADIFSRGEAVVLEPGLNRFALRIERLHLNPGVYGVNLTIARRPATIYDQIEPVGEIEVSEARGDRVAPPGGAVVPCEFRLVTARQETTADRL
jgi:lipopolysaccharide transport system ATP-binding protein